MNTHGGTTGGGVIFSTNPDGTGYTVRKDFTIENPGERPGNSDLVEAANGKLYGVTQYGGINNVGVLFEFDPVTANYIRMFDFDPLINGAYPWGGLTRSPNGKLYGTTNQSGANDKGVIFEFNPVTGVFKKLADLSAVTGGNLQDRLILASNDKLYGVTGNGGAYGLGTLFEYDPITDAIQVKYDFDFTSSVGGSLNLSLASNGKLYGMTGQGGLLGFGIFFEFDPLTELFLKKFDLDQATGFNGIGRMAEVNGKLYGTTTFGGSAGYGTLFEYDLATGNYTVKQNADYAVGFLNGLVALSDGTLYGLGFVGGSFARGSLFSYDAALNSFTGVVSFTDSITGSNPSGTLLEASNGKLYGLAGAGGSEGLGTLFEYEVTNKKLIRRMNFGTSLEGAGPQGTLTQAPNGKLYGMTVHGGVYGQGVLFEMGETPSSYHKWVDFSHDLGSSPRGSLTLAGNGKLYGTTSEGGTYGYGTLFEFDPVTGNFQKKLDFDRVTTGGFTDMTSLTLLNGKLYGAAELSTGSGGEIFEYDPVADIFVVKFIFDNSNGLRVEGDLFAGPDDKLYGTTTMGGTSAAGVLFDYDPAGNHFTKDADFQVSDGGVHAGSLALAPNGKFYGITFVGNGGVYEYDPLGKQLLVKMQFYNGEAPFNPVAGLRLSSNGKLYGLTSHGGLHKSGALIEYDPASAQVTTKYDYVGATGCSPLWNTLVYVGDGRVFQFITFNPLPTKIYGDGPFDLMGTSNAGLPLVYTSSDPTVASIAGNTVTILKTGTTMISAAQPGNGAYGEAPVVQQLLTILKATPGITWAPTNITYLTPLGVNQLNAIANTPGTFTYTPGAGEVLFAGPDQVLSATFTPTDGVNYNTVNHTETLITVTRFTPEVTWPDPERITYGTALSSDQLNATTDIRGGFYYTPDVGTVLNAGPNQILTAHFVPENVNFSPVTTEALITVDKVTPRVFWGNPPTVPYGTALGDEQLDAYADVPGTFTYFPPAGTVLPIGLHQVLSVNFSPTDTTNYNKVNDTQVEVRVKVIKANQTITFVSLETKTMGDPDFTLLATSSSGLPVSLASVFNKVAITGNEVKLLDTGRETIVATQAGTDLYAEAPRVEQSFCVNPARPQITHTFSYSGEGSFTSNFPQGTQWYLNGTAIPGATDQTYNATVTGIYKAQIIIDDCAGEFSEEIAIVITGDLKGSAAIEVYPNPVENYLFVVGLADVQQDAQLIDAVGRNNTLTLEKNGEGYGTNVSHLAPGIYLLRLQPTAVHQPIRFIKK